jgi:hypothetical protein
MPAQERDKHIQASVNHCIEAVTDECVEPTNGPPHLENEQNNEIATQCRWELHGRASRGLGKEKACDLPIFLIPREVQMIDLVPRILGQLIY